VTGQPSGGQRATPNPNSVAGAQMAQEFVNGFPQTNVQSGANATCTVAIPSGTTVAPIDNTAAPVAGYGGDVWGAYGGGATPIGNGVTGTQGWDERVAATVPDGQTAANYQINPNARGAPQQPLQQQVSIGAESQLGFDDALPSGGSNQG
jgi:hypothetical protein